MEAKIYDDIKTYFSSSDQLYGLSIGISEQCVIVRRESALGEGASGSYSIHRICERTAWPAYDGMDAATVHL